MKYIFSIMLFFVPIICISQTFYTVRIEKKIPVVEIIESKPIEKSNIETSQQGEVSGIEKPVGFLALPLKGKPMEITSHYGTRVDPIDGKARFHNGVDLRAKKDTVVSIMAGVVREVKYDKKIGIYIEVDHGYYRTIYGHLSTVFVQVDKSVKPGEPIGITGNTGRSTGEHLHFTIKEQKRPVNPYPFLKLIEIQAEQ